MIVEDRDNRDIFKYCLDHKIEFDEIQDSNYFTHEP